jgi:hypothetical protein
MTRGIATNPENAAANPKNVTTDSVNSPTNGKKSHEGFGGASRGSGKAWAAILETLPTLPWKVHEPFGEP